MAFFGEKDYQQLALVKRMVHDLDLDTEIVGVPTVREPDGLARSSRNRYLSPDERSSALAISAALRAGAQAGPAGGEAALAAARRVLAAEPGIDLDYLLLTDPLLGPAPDSGEGRLLIAGKVGATRLIDNAQLFVGTNGSAARRGVTMQRTMLKSKIHRATVTQADLHYVGSVTVDADLADAADLLDGEQVAIVDITNGARLETYVILGERGSGVIGINGAAAHLVHPGDLVILISYGVMEDAEARAYQPRIVHVDADEPDRPTRQRPRSGTRRADLRARLDCGVRLHDPTAAGPGLGSDEWRANHPSPPSRRGCRAGCWPPIQGGRCRPTSAWWAPASRACAPRCTPARPVCSVIVVTKVNIDDGSTRWAQGGIAAVLDPADTPDAHAKDTEVAGVGLCDPAAVRGAGQRGAGPGPRADRVRRRVRPPAGRHADA